MFINENKCTKTQRKVRKRRVELKMPFSSNYKVEIAITVVYDLLIRLYIILKHSRDRFLRDVGFVEAQQLLQSVGLLVELSVGRTCTSRAQGKIKCNIVPPMLTRGVCFETRVHVVRLLTLSRLETGFSRMQWRKRSDVAASARTRRAAHWWERELALAKRRKNLAAWEYSIDQKFEATFNEQATDIFVTVQRSQLSFERRQKDYCIFRSNELGF